MFLDILGYKNMITSVTDEGNDIPCPFVENTDVVKFCRKSKYQADEN